MSFEAWRPPSVAGRGTTATSQRAARIVGPEETAGPIEWRQIDAAAARGGRAQEATPDMTAQMARLQQECEQRIREAHAAGLREAESAAKVRAAAEVQAALEKLAQSIGDLAQMRGRLRKQAEGDAVKLSLAIAKRVLRREVAMDPDAMRGLATAALEKLQAQEICRVRVSVAQAPAIAAMLRQTPANANTQVIPDGSLPPGGIVFETNQGNLDASVDSQLQEIERGLADHLRKQS